MITFDQLKKDPQICAYISEAGNVMQSMEYTEHSFAHMYIAAYTAAEILEALGADEHEIEIAKIAGLLHDVGNLVNRELHSLTGAVIVLPLLVSKGMDYTDAAIIASAIGNHDEETGSPVNRIAAALIIADKSDVRRSRVITNSPDLKNDIHDRVNYAVEKRRLTVEKRDNETYISMKLDIDTEICQIMDYFEIFMKRMLMSSRAAAFLGTKFELVINGQKVM